MIILKDWPLLLVILLSTQDYNWHDDDDGRCQDHDRHDDFFLMILTKTGDFQDDHGNDHIHKESASQLIRCC